jgi:hypothetical protein
MNVTQQLVKQPCESSGLDEATAIDLFLAPEAGLIEAIQSDNQ